MDHLCSPGGHKGADAKDDCWLTSMPISVHISAIVRWIFWVMTENLSMKALVPLRAVCPPFWLQQPRKASEKGSCINLKAFCGWWFHQFDHMMFRHLFRGPATGLIMTVITPSVHPEIKWQEYRTIGSLWGFFLMLDFLFKTVSLREGQAIYLTPFNWFLLRLCESLVWKVCAPHPKLVHV